MKTCFVKNLVSIQDRMTAWLPAEPITISGVRTETYWFQKSGLDWITSCLVPQLMEIRVGQSVIPTGRRYILISKHGLNACQPRSFDTESCLHFSFLKNSIWVSACLCLFVLQSAVSEPVSLSLYQKLKNKEIRTKASCNYNVLVHWLHSHQWSLCLAEPGHLMLSLLITVTLILFVLERKGERERERESIYIKDGHLF